ncbi:Uncharacterised protein [Mycobacteroides abscessus subsp. abscessus]|nr:Uncharacterised protein [Mycobacteroides abscessus subsp. abscessus]
MRSATAARLSVAFMIGNNAVMFTSPPTSTIKPSSSSARLLPGSYDWGLSPQSLSARPRLARSYVRCKIASLESVIS